MVETVLGYSSSSAAQTFSALGAGSATATFNLGFNNLQNAVIDRLNKKIESIKDTKTVNNVDAFLTLEKQHLERMKPSADTYLQQTVNTRYAVNGILADLNTLADSAQSGDADTFNSVLDRINQDVSMLATPDGKGVNVFVPDGVDDLRTNGVGISAFTDSATASSQVAAALSQVSSVSLMLENEQVNAQDMSDKITARLSSISLSVSADQAAADAEQLAAVQKAKQESGYTLQALSLAFEAQQSFNSQLSQQLQTQTPEPGSILNLFS
jgi:hypothetical protein